MGILDAPVIPKDSTGTRLDSFAAMRTSYAAEQIVERRAAALGPFWAALADADNNPCDIVIVGDSTDEGTGSTSTKFYPENSWPVQLVNALRNSFMTTPTGSPAGYVPGWYAINPAISGIGFTWAGSPTLELHFGGLGCRTVALSSTSHVGTITVSGLTSIDLMFQYRSGAGIVSYQVDSGTVTQINCASASGNQYGQKTRVTLPDTGSHTLTVRYVSGGLVHFEGMMTYNGDETKGIRLWNASHHGFKAGYYTGRLTYNGGGQTGVLSTAWQASMPTTTALVVSGLGLNDYGASDGNIGSAQYRTDMDALNTLIRSRVSTAPIVQLAKFRRGDASGLTAEASDPWSNYVAQLQQIAAADQTKIVIDLSRRIPPTTTDSLGLFVADKVHPNNKGYRFIANSVRQQLIPA